MKSLIVILSSSFLFAAIKGAVAAPSREIDARWLRKEDKRVDIETLAVSPVQDGNDDPNEEYIVVLADHEQRPWADVLNDMGWNTTANIEFKSEHFGYRNFKTDEGVKIQAFGSTLRAFTVSMTNSKGESMKSLGNVAILEKNHKRKFSVMPRNFRQQRRGTSTENARNLRFRNRSRLERRQIAQNPVVGQTPTAGQTPGIPLTPLIPQNPAVPQDPLTPQDPTTPQTPVTPAIPQTPVTPQDPAIPQTPVTDQNPTIPQNSVVPQNPTVPNTQPIRIIQQNTAPWGLQRVSSATKVSVNGRQDVDLTYSYRYNEIAGKGVDVYMVDSGFNVEHVDFGGRLKVIFSPTEDQGVDNIGHGTHTSGTVGSLTYGIAKNANIFGIKVDGPQGPTDGVIVAGLERAITQHLQRSTQSGFMGSIISISIGGPNRGQVLFAALQHFPGGYSKQLPMMTAGATDINDNRADFSNFGDCVSIHAPGVSIVSTSKNGPTATKALDGTSMACPAVTGMMAYELSLNPQFKLDPAGFKQHMVSKALPNVIQGASAVPAGGMVLLNNGYPGSP
ncbi:Cerevisin [Dactylellina cionopaga]|nr:Cerevisin [Dactylellina cionopaga]